MVYCGEDLKLDDSVLRHSAAQASILSFLTLECRETYKLPQHGGLKRDYRSFFWLFRYMRTRPNVPGDEGSNYKS
jgi:hypothetical protein